MDHTEKMNILSFISKLSKYYRSVDTKRIFIAIKINNTDQIRKIFRQVQLDLKDEWIKWVNLNGLHITLAFIGATDIRKIGLIKNRLNQCAEKFSPIELQIKSLGAFPSMQRPRVLWLGVEAEDIIFELRDEILKQLEYIVEISDTRFSPHVTIGRIKHGVKNPDMVNEKLSSHKDWSDEKIQIKEFVLMESKTTSTGTVYEIMESFDINRS